MTSIARSKLMASTLVSCVEGQARLAHEDADDGTFAHFDRRPNRAEHAVQILQRLLAEAVAELAQRFALGRVALIRAIGAGGREHGGGGDGARQDSWTPDLRGMAINLVTQTRKSVDVSRWQFGQDYVGA